MHLIIFNRYLAKSKLCNSFNLGERGQIYGAPKPGFKTPFLVMENGRANISSTSEKEGHVLSLIVKRGKRHF